jgi:hypothetical protein
MGNGAASFDWGSLGLFISDENVRFYNIATPGVNVIKLISFVADDEAK